MVVKVDLVALEPTQLGTGTELVEVREQRREFLRLPPATDQVGDEGRPVLRHPEGCSMPTCIGVRWLSVNSQAESFVFSKLAGHSTP